MMEPSKQDVIETGGRRILFVMATDAEYRDHLRRLFTPFICGVGPVEATATCAWRLAKGDVDLVVSLGSAGSNRLPRGTVVQASHVSYRDMDASAFGFERGVTPFLDLPAVVPLGLAIPGLAQATLSTGASVVSGTAYDAIDADMVDMETWGVMRACHLANAGLVALRGISDGSEEVSAYEHWADHLDAVDEGLAEAVEKLLAHVAAGSYPPRS